jgi:hypothetical protein
MPLSLKNHWVKFPTEKIANTNKDLVPNLLNQMRNQKNVDKQNKRENKQPNKQTKITASIQPRLPTD